MFAGHIGVALAAARIEPRIGAGPFVAAALLLDLLLWCFVLVGWESVVIPTHFPQTHQPEFVFPYSHGLLASLAWSGVAGMFVFWWFKDRGIERARPAWLVAGVVFSHWLLDALVHRPELPFAGATSRPFGAGLWNHLPVALAVEAALVLVGLSVFLPGCGLSRPKTLALALLSLLVLAFTVLGMTVAPPPPSALAMAGSSLGAVVLVCVLLGWLARGARSRQA